MFGWEYPPHISGGLGTACHGLTTALIKAGHQVSFVLPRVDEEQATSQFKLISASNYSILNDLDTNDFTWLSSLIPEIGLKQFLTINGGKHKFSGGYGANLIEEVYWFSIVASQIANNVEFDIIHAHDWLTYLAGVMVKKITGKPLVVHMHATEFDRSAKTNWQVYEIERYGMTMADKVFAVSNLTRDIIVGRYHISPEKVITTYNGVVPSDHRLAISPRKLSDQIVTFLGRITYQKGPEFFIEAAEKVLRKIKNVRFVMAGNGDMMPAMIEKVAAKRLSSHFHFTGFLKGSEVAQMLNMTDVLVMPSVSEPFGITPLEAIQCDVPVVISKQSGVAEVLPHSIKTDYWDVNKMADAIYSLLSYKPLAKTVQYHNRQAIHNLSWEKVASKVSSTYLSVA